LNSLSENLICADLKKIRLQSIAFKKQINKKLNKINPHPKNETPLFERANKSNRLM